MTESVVIIGAGNFAKQVIDVFELTGIKIKGCIDDHATGSLYNYPILGKIDYLESDKNSILFCGIGDVKAREKFYNSLFQRKWINCIHPSAQISKHTLTGVGNYIGPNVSIMPGVNLGNNNIVDPAVVLSHDCTIGDNNHFAAFSCLLGSIKVGSRNLFGSHAVVLPKLIVGNRNILGAGAVITKSIDDDHKMIGIPAKDMSLKVSDKI